MSDAIEHRIKLLAARYAAEFVAVRQHLHAHPELSFQEFKTAAYVQEQLTRFNIPFRVKGTTGVIGLLEGRNPGKRVVALRADMDALPILEENDLPYRSQNPGVMHACGHDAHTACLLGAAKILSELRTEWEGTVKFIFQPGEEKNPGGASILINEGVLENPAPQSIFGLHVHTPLALGKLSFRGGMVMASADEIYISIKAKGGHAAQPHLTADTVLIASSLVVNLQQVISRNNNPFNPSVLSFTSIQGGNTTNVIPAEVKLMGTFRAMNEKWRFEAHEIIRKLAIGLAESMGAVIDVRIDVGYPHVFNNEKLSAAAAQKAAAYIGPENVEETELRMGAEDFAFYTHHIPGCFFRLGCRNEAKGITIGGHTPTFNIDEDAIELGMGIMAVFGATNAE